CIGLRDPGRSERVSEHAVARVEREPVGGKQQDPEEAGISGPDILSGRAVGLVSCDYGFSFLEESGNRLNVSAVRVQSSCDTQFGSRTLDSICRRQTKTQPDVRAGLLRT